MQDMGNLKSEQVLKVGEQFDYGGKMISVSPFGNGHINDTFLVTVDTGDGRRKPYILQKMNKDVFHKPLELMENVMGVTSFLRKKIIAVGGNPERETLTIIPDKEGHSCYKDSAGEYWRSMLCITGVKSYDLVEKPSDFYESGYSFGKFQSLLSDYPAASLHETIEGFHDTAARFLVFQNVVAKDACGRVSSSQPEIDFVRKHEDLAHVFGDLLAKKEVPLRVTHNDTKLNNILIDDETGKGICVIDLDTVMPGLAMNDFGDSIRFGANTALEDEQDLSKVSCDLELYEAFTKGFLEGCDGKLTAKEVELLPMGALVMTYECGLRFLADHLVGDVYFKIHREGHNLDRARTQFKLIEDMLAKWESLQEITRCYA